jgi:hypothetical protein
VRTAFVHREALKFAVLSLLTGLALLTAVPAFAQEVPGGEALVPYLVLICVLMFVPYFAYWALTTQIIARKTNTENGWMAWIPIANLILWANIARKPFWWGLLCIVPVVGLVFMALVWMAIAETRKKPNWWGILSVVPVVGLVVPGYLAWSS